MTHENKFGMFIHWGVYAQTGVQDQVYARMNWDREKYESLINDKSCTSKNLLYCFQNSFKTSFSNFFLSNNKLLSK